MFYYYFVNNIVMILNKIYLITEYFFFRSSSLPYPQLFPGNMYINYFIFNSGYVSYRVVCLYIFCFWILFINNIIIICIHSSK